MGAAIDPKFLRQERAKTPEGLLKKQQLMGKVNAGVGGATALVGQGVSMVNEAKNINTAAPTQQLDSFGRPMYNLGAFTSQVSAINPHGASGGELLTGAMNGAQAGMAIGGPWGAAIGAVVGTASTALFGKRRKTLQERKKTLAQQNLFNAQRMYNQGIQAYNNIQSAQSLYNDQMMSVDQRMNNVYQALS